MIRASFITMGLERTEETSEVDWIAEVLLEGGECCKTVFRSCDPERNATCPL